MTTFRAVVRCRGGQTGGLTSLVLLSDDDLMPGDVDVVISFSTLCRHDALLACGESKLGTRRPLILGSDLAGVVSRSAHPRWREGDAVIATGRGLGQCHHGGWAERARVPGEWLQPQPDGLTPHQAMTIGSSGLAAMQAALALEYHGLLPELGPVAVTGATGAVGASSLLALTCLGFSATAVTGRVWLDTYLRSLGAVDVMETSALKRFAHLGPEHWAGAIDVLGGSVLSALLATVRRGGAVVSCGGVACDRTATSLAPFNQRSVALLGVDALYASRSRHSEAWERWAECDGGKLALLGNVIGLDQVLIASDDRLGRRSRGTTVINLTGEAPTKGLLH